MRWIINEKKKIVASSVALTVDPGQLAPVTNAPITFALSLVSVMCARVEKKTHLNVRKAVYLRSF